MLRAQLNCLFCKIAQQEIPANIVYETPDILAFKDIAPQAPVHVLIIPKKHITTINDLQEGDHALVGQMIFTAKELAKEMEIHEQGYRLVYNVNQQGGQAVYHIHLHLLGGRQLHWPPG